MGRRLLTDVPDDVRSEIRRCIHVIPAAVVLESPAHRVHVLLRHRSRSISRVGSAASRAVLGSRGISLPGVARHPPLAKAGHGSEPPLHPAGRSGVLTSSADARRDLRHCRRHPVRRLARRRPRGCAGGRRRPRLPRRRGPRADRRVARARRAADPGAGPRAAERARLLCLRGPRRRGRPPARTRDRPVLVRGARLLFLQPGGDPRAGRGAEASRDDDDARLRARDRRGDRRRRGRPARDRRLHPDERLVGARRAGGGGHRRPRAGEGEGLRHQPRSLDRHPRRASLRGRSAADPGAGARQRRRGRLGRRLAAALRLGGDRRSRRPGHRAAPRRRARLRDADRRVPARARPAAAGRGTGAPAGSSQATWSPSRPTGWAGSKRRSPSRPAPARPYFGGTSSARRHRR